MRRPAVFWIRKSQTAATSMLLVAAVFLLAGCGQPDPICEDPMGCIQIPPGESIQIGALLALSGSAAFLGQDSLGGIEIALADRENVLLERPIELISADAGCNAETATEAIARLTDFPFLAGIIGPNCATAAAAALPTVNNRRLALISPSVTASSFALSITDETSSYRPGFYRTIYDNHLQAVTAAEFAYEALSARTAVILYDDTHYRSNLPSIFAQTFKQLGGRVLMRQAFRPGQTGTAELAVALGQTNPDVIYLLLFEPEAAKLIIELTQQFGTARPDVVGFDGLMLREFSESASSAADGIFIVGSAVTGAPYTALIDKWTLTYGATPAATTHAYAYDATNLLLDTIEAIAIKETDGTLTIGKKALRDALSETRDYPGVTGALTCQSYGQCASNSTLGVYQLVANESGIIAWPPPLVWKKENQSATPNP